MALVTEKYTCPVSRRGIFIGEFCGNVAKGGVAEWSKAAVLKTVVAVRSPWVRILPPPPEIRKPRFFDWGFLFLRSAVGFEPGQKDFKGKDCFPLSA